MKKIFVFLMLISILFLTGCGKENAESVFKDLTNKINKLNGYTLSGSLEVKNNNSNYTYDVSVSYMKNDKYRVSLVNTSNNHEQVILRNDDGVFVLTPSLNKSFKFQSDWPYNNSQVYILSSIIDDLNKDNELKKEEKDGKYIFTSKVNYPNNNKLTTQIVTVSKDLFIEKIEVLKDDGTVEMTFTINNTDYNPTFDEAYFEVNSIINNKSNDNNVESKDNTENSKNTNENSNSVTCDPKIDTNCKTENTNENSKNNTNNSVDNNSNKTATNQSNKNQDNTLKSMTLNINMSMNGLENDKDKKINNTASLEDVIYPLYLPTGTVLKDQEKVSKTDGERIILTFVGDKGFTLVEETATKEKEFTIIPTYGEPGFVNDTIGAITDNSLNWISNGVEYYMVSDVMNTIELLDVANSINVTAVANLK